MDATTTLASTVIRSIPTRDTRTQASITIPLSSTRSRTSIRLVPPAARSTGIGHSRLWAHTGDRSFEGASRRSSLRQRGEFPLQGADLLAQLVVLRRERLLAGRK